MPRSALGARKPIAALVAEEADPRGPTLAKNLSAFSLVCIGVGATVGAGIFVLTGTAAANYAGPGLMLSFVLGAVASGLVALCYAELAAMIPVAGSTYSYTYVTLGALPAWIIGWDLVLEFAMAAATIAVGWSGYAQSLLADAGLRLPAWLAAGPGEGGIVNLPAALVVLALTALLMRDNREAARTNAVLVALKVAIILACLGVGHLRPDLWQPLVPPNEGPFGAFGWSGIFRGAGVVFFAYVGFETISTAAGETRNPQRDAPVGLIGSLLVTAALYVAVAAVLTGLVPYRDLDVADPIARAMAVTGLTGFSAAIKAGALIGLTTAALTALYGQARICYAMARDHMLPDLFARIGERSRTPFVAQGVIGLATAVVAALVPIGILGELVSIGTLFAFILVCASVLILRRTEPERARPFRVPGGAIVPVLGILACLALMASLPGDTWLRLLAWLGLGLAIWFGYSRRRVGAHSGFERTAPFAGPGQRPG
ncbi:amino acid permease [Methylobacterium sp. AMS5]|uniref:amino acid permease n=1 Tax=Methylobacterium sp. AMS5 TaxID=925818 RepID=UPI00074F8669|nr:amino acid permease [Methylobacterium sp. AMS5]AMB47242.1 amino acid permease [Methylobacterium sp. AMS5]